MPNRNDVSDPSAAPQASAEADTPERQVETAAAKAPTPNIPWGYGEDVVCAMAVDPVQLFVYWELSDESIAASRTQFPQNAETWLLLRIYDTSARLFDGTNAHSHVDHGLQRSDRQWFCQIGKPTSSAHVEVGLIDANGQFVSIARSGRVDFPRRDPVNGGHVDPHHVEWMTVTEEGISQGPTGGWGSGAPPGSGDGPSVAPPGDSSDGSGLQSHATPSSAERGRATQSPDPSAPGSAHSEVAVHTTSELRREWTWEAHEHSNWTSFSSDAGSDFSSWSGRGDVVTWQSGPFSEPVEIVSPSVERTEGSTQVHQWDNSTHVLHGPWQVVIRGLGAHASRQVVARWSVHRTWEVPSATRRHQRSIQIRPHALGASEQRLESHDDYTTRGASELRLMGSSERHLLGASELRLFGASERLFLAASERRLHGASEHRLSGSKPQRFVGASGRLPPSPELPFPSAETLQFGDVE